MSRTRRDNMATLKPTTPPLTHNKAPLKPPSPLHPKTAPKTPISHPQRRWRFHSHALTSEQRRRDGFRQPGHLADRARLRHPRALKLCPAPPFHTWSLSLACGPDDLHLGPMRCAWAAPPTCTSRGLRAHQGVNAHVQRFACEQHSTTDTTAPKTQTTSPTTTRFHRFLPRWSALCALHQPKPRSDFHQTGEMASLEIRHAGDTPPASL